MSLLPTNPENYTFGADNASNSVFQLMVNASKIALGIAGGIAVIYIIIGAFYYLTAYGNEDKISQGKKTITWAIIGVVVIAFAELIISAIWHFVSGSSFSFPF